MISVILTGKTVPGHNPEAAWTAASRLFNLDADHFRARVAKRIPISIKQTPDAAEAQRYCTGLARCGLEAESYEADGSKWEFQQDGRICGPVPLAYLTRECAAGSTIDLPVRRLGEVEWIAMAQALLPAAARVISAVPPPPRCASTSTRPRSPFVGRMSANDDSFRWLLTATLVIALYFAARQQWVEYCAFLVVSLVAIGSYLGGFGKTWFKAIPLYACLLIAVLSAYATRSVFATHAPGVSSCNKRGEEIARKACAQDDVEMVVAGLGKVDDSPEPDRLKQATSTWAHKDASAEAAPDCRHVVDPLEPYYVQCRLLRRGVDR